MKNLILMGPPGAGKGTQAKMLAEKMSLFHLSTGDILRETAKKETSAAQELRKILAAGAFPSDALIVEIVAAALSEVLAQPKYQGVIFDGMPRTVAQAEYLDRWFESHNHQLPKVISIVVPDDDLMERITGRLVCGQCKASYNIHSKAPKTSGVCDACGAPALEKRADDTPESFKKRLEIYRAETKPVIHYFQKQNRVFEIKGTGEMQDILNQILEILSKIE